MNKELRIMKFFTSLHQFDIRYSIFCCSLLSIFSLFTLHSSMLLFIPQVDSDYFFILLNVMRQVFRYLFTKT